MFGKQEENFKGIVQLDYDYKLKGGLTSYVMNQITVQISHECRIKYNIHNTCYERK